MKQIDHKHTASQRWALEKSTQKARDADQCVEDWKRGRLEANAFSFLLSSAKGWPIKTIWESSGSNGAVCLWDICKNSSACGSFPAKISTNEKPNQKLKRTHVLWKLKGTVARKHACLVKHLSLPSLKALSRGRPRQDPCWKGCKGIRKTCNAFLLFPSSGRLCGEGGWLYQVRHRYNRIKRFNLVARAS